ncbi:MAG: hypothetical protein KJ949_00735 [Nanoarchaeota archaeon]|nr:hypothetical protein [Nanoarchaeota archaeon]
MKLEQRMYELVQESKENLRVYVVSDLESLSSVALYYGNKGSPLGSLGSFGIVKTSLMTESAPNVESVRSAKNTEYFNLLNTSSQTIGVTHHPVGLGKLKIFDNELEIEYGVPIIDILNKPLRNWRIDKK